MKKFYALAIILAFVVLGHAQEIIEDPLPIEDPIDPTLPPVLPLPTEPAVQPQPQPPPPIVQGSPWSGDALKKVMLEEHKKERATKRIGALRWNSALQRQAKRHANRGTMTHIKPKGVGQNIAMGTASAYTPAQLFRLWIGAEKRKYKKAKCPKISYSNFGKFGHYTQVMWKKTKYVGCGAAKKGSAMYLVCNYKPAGNMVGQKPFSGCI